MSAEWSTVDVTTAGGIDATVRVAGSGPPLVHLHGAGGLSPSEPMLDRLASAFRVYAPEWPGYGPQPTETMIEEMIDFTLHGWDLIEALELGDSRPTLSGHSMGGMIAAEMAAMNPRALTHLVLINPAGLWLDSHPIPDIFAMLPFQLAEALFADPEAGEAMLTGGLDFGDNEAMKTFLIGNARRLGTAGKILFPIPNRRLSKRLYRITTPTTIIWGAEDKLIDPKYADAFCDRLTSTTARVVLVDGAGHMTPYEQPEAAAEAVLEIGP